MVVNNEDPKMTAFTVTVDAKLGTTTGISAGDRATTLRALADSEVNVAAELVEATAVFGASTVAECPWRAPTLFLTGYRFYRVVRWRHFGRNKACSAANTHVLGMYVPVLFRPDTVLLLSVVTVILRASFLRQQPVLTLVTPTRLSMASFACAGFPTRLQQARSHIPPPIHGELPLGPFNSLCN